MPVENLSVKINLLLVVDADLMRSNCPRPSRNPKKPLPLSAGAWFLVGSAAANIQESSEAAVVSLRLPSQGQITMRTISASGNYGGACLLYNRNPATSEVATPDAMELSYVTLAGAVQPDPDAEDGLPPIYVAETFTMRDLKLAGLLGLKLVLPIALYQLSRNGQNQILYGYFALQLHLLPVIPK